MSQLSYVTRKLKTQSLAEQSQDANSEEQKADDNNDGGVGFLAASATTQKQQKLAKSDEQEGGHLDLAEEMVAAAAAANMNGRNIGLGNSKRSGNLETIIVSSQHLTVAAGDSLSVSVANQQQCDINKSPLVFGGGGGGLCDGGSEAAASFSGLATTITTTDNSSSNCIDSSVDYSSEEELKEIIISSKKHKRSSLAAKSSSRTKSRNSSSSLAIAVTPRGSIHCSSSGTVSRSSNGGGSRSSSRSKVSGATVNLAVGGGGAATAVTSAAMTSLAANNASSSSSSSSSHAEKRKWSEVGSPSSNNSGGGAHDSEANATSSTCVVRCRSRGTLSAPANAPRIFSSSFSCSSAGSSSHHSDEASVASGFVTSDPTSGDNLRISEVATPVQFCTSPPLDVHRPKRQAKFALPLPPPTNDVTSGRSPPTKMFHFQPVEFGFVNPNQRTTRSGQVLSSQDATDQDLDSEVCAAIAAAGGATGSGLPEFDSVLEAGERENGCDVAKPSAIRFDGKNSQLLNPVAAADVGARSSAADRANGRDSSQQLLRRRSHSQTRLHNLRRTNSSPNKKYHHKIFRGGGNNQSGNGTGGHSSSSSRQRPCLDFEKMQQIKKRVVTSWRPQGGELSLFCW